MTVKTTADIFDATEFVVKGIGGDTCKAQETYTCIIRCMCTPVSFTSSSLQIDLICFQVRCGGVDGGIMISE